MRRHRARPRLRRDLFAVTGVSLLVIALALAAVLSIVAGSPGDERDKRLVTELTDTESTDDDPSGEPSGDLGR